MQGLHHFTICLALSCVSEPPEPPRPSFRVTQAAPMRDVRFSHGAELLADGRVLVGSGYAYVRVMGRAEVAETSTAEIFDPMAGTWAPAGVPGLVWSLTRLPSGRALGLRSTAPVLFEPSTLKWSASTPPWPINDTVCRLEGRGALVVGGTRLPSRSAQVFVDATSTWELAAEMGVARGGVTCGVFPDGRILVAGGAKPSSAEIYQPAKNAWSPTGALPIDVQKVVVLGDGRAVVLGGSPGSEKLFSSVYNSTNGQWAAPVKSEITLVPEFQVAAVGNDSIVWSSGSASVRVFNITTSQWSDEQSVRAEASLTRLRDGRVLATGGQAEAFSPESEMICSGCQDVGSRDVAIIATP